MTESQSTKAQRRIKSALAELLSEKTLQSLSVSDIARRARVNRGTFYLYYTDKFDLMRQLADATMADISAIITKPASTPSSPGGEVIPRDTIVRLLEYMRSDIAFVQALIGPNGIPSLAEQLKAIVIANLRQRLADAPAAAVAAVDTRPEPAGASTVRDMPQDYLDELLMSSVVSVILLWIRRGAAEPPEQVADLIDAARRLSPLDLLALSIPSAAPADA